MVTALLGKSMLAWLGFSGSLRQFAGHRISLFAVAVRRRQPSVGPIAMRTAESRGRCTANGPEQLTRQAPTAYSRWRKQGVSPLAPNPHRAPLDGLRRNHPRR